MKKTIKIILFILVLLFLLGLLVPQRFRMPVENATAKDYNPNTFWYYPWGKSVTHKGVDIFAKEGTNLYSATDGLVVFTGNNRLGGNVVVILGPKWRFHYYAHLQDIKIKPFTWATRNNIIGTVGKTGNAVNTPPHLHYAIITPIPYIWRKDNSKQGWMKMFYLNPIDYLKDTK